MAMAPQTHPIALGQRRRSRHLGALESAGRRDSHEGGPGPAFEVIGNVLAFGLEDAAGGVDEPAAGLQQSRRRGEDRPLGRPKVRERGVALAPLQVGMAAQGARSGAWRIDEHAVDLARQARDALVTLARDLRRVDVAEAAALQARLQRGEPVAGDVERVEATGVAHLRAERERLAARPRAEVDDDIVAPRADEKREQLAALVLHLHEPLREDVALLQRGLADDAYAERRMRCRRRSDARTAELLDDIGPVGLERVHAKIERCRPSHGVDPGPELAGEAPLQRRGEPLREVVAKRLGQGPNVHLAAGLQPLALGRVERRLQHLLAAAPGEDGEPTFERSVARARGREVAPQRELAKHREDAVGEVATVARTERVLFAKEIRDDTIGGMLEAQHATHELGLRREQRGRMHAQDYPRAVRKRSSAQLDVRPSHLFVHRRLIVCLVVGALVGATWPGIDSLVLRSLLGWNVLVWLYLGVVAVAIARADHGHIKRLALEQAESAGAVLMAVVGAAVISLVAVISQLIAAKAGGPQHMVSHLVFGTVTVLGSWLLLPTLFAVTYASAYYGPQPDRGLAFPDSEKDFEPDHTDFLYFSFTIAVTAQTSDVGVTTRAMRRLVLAQSILSFVFNTTILAFSVNAAASFF